MSDSMNEPVTRAELREELMELREELATKADKADLVPLATHFALEMWIGALREELKADAQQREERITSTITEHVSTEIARHVGAVLERARTEIGAVDEKYRDVPPRLANIEAQAHTHTEPPPKKVTGRRSR
jgi:hypothetical protein